MYLTDYVLLNFCVNKDSTEHNDLNTTTYKLTQYLYIYSIVLLYSIVSSGNWTFAKHFHFTTIMPSPPAYQQSDFIQAKHPSS